jgi:hypothetical protein
MIEALCRCQILPFTVFILFLAVPQFELRACVLAEQALCS